MPSKDYAGKKRSELEDDVFGISQERKYPMPDEKHTRSAIKLFNHVEPKYEEQLAKAIIKNMKKYNIDGSIVGKNNRLRKYLPKDMVKESSIEEGVLVTDKDIYYNKDKFDSGEINLCFVTGLSGSGKSTMGRSMASSKVDHYELDDLIFNDNFSDDNLKEYGELIYSFFKGPGKSFRLIHGDDSQNAKIFDKHKKYEEEIVKEFVKYAISFAKLHKSKKYVCDGVWIYMFIKPSVLKDCAVYIKGTSSVKSLYRAVKRDTKYGKEDEGLTTIQAFKRSIMNKKDDVLHLKKYQQEISTFRKYFTDLITESSIMEGVSNSIDKDHKQNGYIKLSSLKKIKITENIISKYNKKYPYLRNVRCKDTNEYTCDGYMWFRDDDLVCHVGSCQYTDDNTKWIVSLEILPKYRGYGLSKQILDFSTTVMKCKYLSVSKNNKLAKKIYDNYGFRVYQEDKNMYYMTIDPTVAKESSSISQIKNVVFDIGDVLIHDTMKETMKGDPDISNDIIDTLLDLWFIEKDEIAYVSLDDFVHLAAKRLGEFSSYVPKLLQYNQTAVKPFGYTVPMIRDLQNKGYKVYFLSNWSAWSYELLRDSSLRFVTFMDGGVWSFEAKSRKPNENIYKELFTKYKLNPEECIFFDDKKENVEASEKFGMKAVQFDYEHPEVVYSSLCIDSNVQQEIGATAGTMVGSNQSADAYIISYTQNNVFSGNKTKRKLAVSRKDMSVIATPNNGLMELIDRDKFISEASDIKVYKVKTPCDDTSYGYRMNSVIYDEDIYKEFGGIYDTDYVQDIDTCLYDDPNMERIHTDIISETAAIRECILARTAELTTGIKATPVLTENVSGRYFNFYRDLDGVFVRNELSGIRSKSYDTVESIPVAEFAIVSRGYL